MKLSEQVFQCQNRACRHVRDRDFNAAINLENAPDDRVRWAGAEFTPADASCDPWGNTAIATLGENP